ncbi:MAG: CDP-alcohol phosphatidyltransferase family protein, partial [Thermodesulfobacteriota bacterium]
RLARFNIQANEEEKYSFSGLPSPMAAGLMFAPVMLLSEFTLSPSNQVIWFYLIASPLIGIIMVSDIPYRKFSDLKMKGPFNMLVIAAIIISAVISNPSIMVTIIVYSYFILGLVTYVYYFVKKKEASKEKTADFFNPKN